MKNVFIVGVTPDDKQYEDLENLKKAFEEYGCKVTLQRNIWSDGAEMATEENDILIYALVRTMHRPIGPLDFWGDEAGSIWASNCSDKKKTVVVSFGMVKRNEKLQLYLLIKWLKTTRSVLQALQHRHKISTKY